MTLDIEWGVELDRVVLFPLFTSGDNKGGIQAVDESAYEGVEVPGPVSLDFKFGSPRTIANTSQGRVNDTIVLPSLDPKTGTLAGSYNSQVLNSLLTGAKVTTMGAAKVLPETTSEEGKEIQCAMLVQQLVSHDDEGNSMYVSEFFAKVTLVPQKTSYGEKATAKNYEVAFSPSAKYGWGEVLTLADHGVTKAVSGHVISNDRWNVVGWLGDNVATAFTLPTDKPAKTSAAAKVWNYFTGVEEVGAWDASINAITFTPTVKPGAGELLIVTYEW